MQPQDIAVTFCNWLILLLSLVADVTTEQDIRSFDFYRLLNQKVTGVALIPVPGPMEVCAVQCAVDDACPGFNAVRADDTCELVKNLNHTELTFNNHQGTDYYKAGLDTNLLTMPGVTCSASSIESGVFDCENAYDGVTDAGYGNEWTSLGEGDGARLEVTFPLTVLVQSIEIWQRCHVVEQYSRFRLTFSDGSTQEVATPCNGGGDWLDCSGVPSEYRQLTPVLTSSVRITGYGDCQAGGNGGIIEMKINA